MKNFRLYSMMAAMIGAAGMISQAQEAEVVNNPVLPDGSYVVKYDIENHKFAESNDFEIDETFVFAIDVTGTSYVDALATTGRNPAVIGRGMARDIYANNEVNQFEHFASGANLDGRMFHIEGNIYGMVFNIKQYAEGLYKDGPLGYVEGGTMDACQPGATTTFGMNVFPFGYSATNQGEEWWNAIAEPIYSTWFTTAPYTGTKTGADFYFNDYTPGEAFPGCSDSVNSDKGWAMPEYAGQIIGGAGISSVAADSNAAPEYYTLQGVKVSAPANGLYICVKGNKATKVLVK